MKNTLRRKCLKKYLHFYCMILYINEWFNSSSSIITPLEDLTFIKNLLHYTSIDKDLSQNAAKQFYGHL